MFETYRLDVWTMALNLPRYEVCHCAEDGIDEVLRLNIIPKQVIELCPNCGCPCNSWRQKRWLENILDLPLGGRAVSLKVRVFQYQCDHCGRNWTPHSPIVEEGTWATKRLVERGRTGGLLGRGQCGGLFRHSGEDVGALVLRPCRASDQGGQ